jgi:hypothetical protein
LLVVGGKTFLSQLVFGPAEIGTSHKPTFLVSTARWAREKQEIGWSLGG